MEIKNKPPLGGLEKTANSLLKQQINNFLINYFGYLTLALAVIIFAAGLFLFVYPQYRQLAKSAKVAKNQLQAEQATKTSYLGVIRDLKNSYQLISGADRQKIEEMVPVGNQAISLIPEFESIALKNGVILNYVKIAEDSADQPRAKINVGSGENQAPAAGIFEQLPGGVGLTKIEISLSSVSYPVLKNLLKTFENNLWLLDLAKVNYDAEENKAVLTIYSYYLIR